MKDEELRMIRALREQGYAVAIMSPSEIGRLDPTMIESQMVERANEVISLMSPADCTENEKKILNFLIETMKSRGWAAYRLEDGGEDPIFLSGMSVADIIEDAMTVEDSTIYFRKNTLNAAVRFIFGNGNAGRDVIADHANFGGQLGDEFLSIIQRTYDFSEML